MTSEIPGSPISRHDLGVLWKAVIRARLSGRDTDEIHVSARRVVTVETLRVFGIMVVPREDLALNEALLICSGREPTAVSLEDSAGE